MGGGAVLKFPVKFPVSASLQQSETNPLPSDVVDRSNAGFLLETTDYVIQSAKVLIGYLGTHRNALRQVGIETVIVELSGIAASGRLEGIKDTLEEAVKSGREAKLTLEGLSYLKRSEKLVAEAFMGVSMLTENTHRKSVTLGENPAPPQVLAQVEKPAISSELLLIGLVSIVALTILVIAFMSKRE